MEVENENAFWVNREGRAMAQAVSRLSITAISCRSVALLLMLLFTGRYRTRRPINCDHYWSIMLPHLTYNNSWFIHKSCGSNQERNIREFDYKYLFHTVAIFNMP
jgi:hypothetical protein